MAARQQRHHDPLEDAFLADDHPLQLGEHLAQLDDLERFDRPGRRVRGEDGLVGGRHVLFPSSGVGFGAGMPNRSSSS